MIAYKNEISLKGEVESHPSDHWLNKAEEIDFPIEISLQHSFLPT